MTTPSLGIGSGIIQVVPSSGGGGASVGLSSARPAATGSGKTYYCTDLACLYVDDPTLVAWQQFATSGLLATPAAIGSYTKVGNLYLSQQADAIRAVSTDNKANCGLISGSLPSSGTWIVTLKARLLPSTGNYPSVGVCVTNGVTSGTSTSYDMSYWYSTYQPHWHLDSYTIGTTTRLNVALDNQNVYNAQSIIYSRLLADGVYLHYQFSHDGYSWFDWENSNPSGLSSPFSTIPTGLTDYGFIMAANGSTPTFGVGVAEILENALTALTVPQQSISVATNATPIVLTVGSTAAMLDGDVVQVTGVTGNSAANTVAYIHIVDGTHVQMLGVAGVGAGTGGTLTVTSR